MFKPTNPKLDMLLAKIKETKNKQNELDVELTELLGYIVSWRI